MAKFVWKRASKKAKTSKRRMKALRTQVYTPYPSIRGTNPANQTTFKGKGFPDRLTTNVVYSDSFILDPSAGTPTPYKTYLLTSGFDPDNALGGGQPTYWDQLAAVYSRYKVNGAKITATFSKSSTISANEGPYICGIECSDSTSLPTTNAGVLISTPNTSFRIVGQEDGSKSVVATYSSKSVYPDFVDGLQARMTSNPTINWYAKVFASPQGVDIEKPINVIIIIEYNVTLSDVIGVVDV